MLKVGITGGIGSGKSVVASIFKSFNVPVLDADARAKRLMVEDENLRQSIISIFGKSAYENGELNRALISKRVFNDPYALKQLNAAVHPVVIDYGIKWMEAHHYLPYVIKEAALFFESGSAGEMDYIIGVASPYKLRLKRAMKRDGVDEHKTKSRMANQIDEKIKMMLCDYIVHNDDVHALLPQVLELDRLFSSGTLPAKA